MKRSVAASDALESDPQMSHDQEEPRPELKSRSKANREYSGTDAKKKMILAAGIKEFSSFGLAGARVDRARRWQE